MKTSKPMTILLATASLCALLAVATPETRAGEINTGYFGNVAIEGYDPVAYFTLGKAVLGKNEYALDWLGAEWHFLSEEHRELFAENPIAYAPQYGGHCADGVGYGDKTANIDPQAWVIIDQKLYLNSGPAMREEFVQSPDIRKQAEANWPTVQAYLLSQ